MSRYDPNHSGCSLCRGTGWMTVQEIDREDGKKVLSSRMERRPCLMGCKPKAGPTDDDGYQTVATIPWRDHYL